jgi:hypothetical protein
VDDGERCRACSSDEEDYWVWNGAVGEFRQSLNPRLRSKGQLEDGNLDVVAGRVLVRRDPAVGWLDGGVPLEALDAVVDEPLVGGRGGAVLHQQRLRDALVDSGPNREVEGLKKRTGGHFGPVGRMMT